MKTRIRVVALIMASAMLIPASTACRKTTGTSSSSTSSGSSSNKEKTLADDTVVDMQGYNFVIASAWLRNTAPRDATTFERLWHQRKEEVEKKYNCTITIENFYADMENLIPKIVAGEKVGDVVQMISDMWMPAAGAGYLRPWDDVSDVINVNDLRWNSSDATTVNGKHYVLEFERPGDVGTVLWYNKDLLKKAGITEDPAQLALDGKWTWDKFREMLDATTMDTNADGTMDTYGLFSLTGYTDIAYALAASNGSSILSSDFSENYSKSAFMEAINFFDQLINKDKVVRTYNNMSSQDTWNSMPTSDTFYNEFRTGKVAFLSSRLWVGNQQLKPYMEGNYGMVVYPKGPQATSYITMADTMGGYALTATNSDYKKSAIIFNALARPAEGYEDDSVMQETIADDFFQDNDTTSYQMYDLARNTVKVDYGFGVSTLMQNLNHAVIESCFWRIDTPAAAIEGLKGVYTDDIQSTYKKLLQ